MSTNEVTASSALELRSKIVRSRPGVADMASWIGQVLRVRSERRKLMTLDERMLKDVGLSRADADGEASRALFDLPERGC